MWATLGVTGSTGQRAFPEVSPTTGGSICSIPILISDDLLAGTVLLADASGLAAASGDITLDQYREASVQLDTAPDSSQTASTNLVNLWQNNLQAIVVERAFCAVRLRSDAVALVNIASSYQGGFSPP